MSQFFYIHPDNPQQRLINQAVEIVRKGGVIVYPTDSGYALGCKIEDKNAMERICRIRQLPDGHNFTLMCRDLSELSTYSFVDNVAFRLMKNNTPGNYAFILKGTKEYKFTVGSTNVSFKDKSTDTMKKATVFQSDAYIDEAASKKYFEYAVEYFKDTDYAAGLNSSMMTEAEKLLNTFKGGGEE